MRALGLIAVAGVLGWLLALPALAATFVLEGGETVEGTIVDATRNTIVIRRTDGGMRQLPVARLERVRITTADGQTLRGWFRGWQDGRTEIMVGSEVVWIEDDQVVERTATARPALAPDTADQRAAPPEPAAPAVAAAPVPVPARQAPPEPAAGPTPAALSPGELPAVSVRITPAEVTEKTGEIVFTVELSRPVDKLLVLIYSTVDGAAHAGTDYTAGQGILTLAAGETKSEIRTAILDDTETEGEEEFSLFLAANPELARIEQQWTRVTIEDDD